MLSRLLPLAAVVVGVHLAPATVFAEEPLLASVVSVEITPPVGVPLAGYGGGGRREIDILCKHPYASYLKPSTGVLDPIYVKILILKKGQRQLAFIAYDLIGASAKLRHDIAKDLAAFGFRPDEVFVSGTHTHSGPGDFAQNWVWELIATDRFVPEIYHRILSDTWKGLMQAMLALEPAELSAFNFQAQGLQHNRRGHAGHFDPTANVLLVRRADGQFLGGIANLAVHGTSLPSTSLVYSADTPGAMRAELEATLARMNSESGPRHPAVLFINGAEGDVAPAEGGADGMAHLGRSFAAQAEAAIGAARPIDPVWNVSHTMVDMGLPGLGVKACLNAKSDIVQILGDSLMGIAWTAFPTKAEISAIQLGDLELLTWPGEPTTTAGLELKKLALAQGAREAWVFGLTNDHLAYFTMPDEYAEGGYEGCVSIYGANGAVKILDAFQSMLGHGVSR
jgi:hypothetical protein